MASKDIEVALVLVLATMLWHGAVAQSGCTTVIMGLAPCLNYIMGNSSTPSFSCCSQLATVVQSQPQCLCTLLNVGGAGLGISINQTLALALPGACNVRTPPVSNCNAANGMPTPPTSPVSPPSVSPADSTIPSESSTQETGSKTVPTTDERTSNGSSTKLCHHLTVFFLFVASFTLNVIRC